MAVTRTYYGEGRQVNPTVYTSTQKTSTITQPPTPTTIGTAQYGTITVNTSQRQPGWSVVAPGYTTTSTGQVVPVTQQTTATSAQLLATDTSGQQYSPATPRPVTQQTTTPTITRPLTPTERISQSAQNLAITQAITQRKPYEEIYIKPQQIDVKTTMPIREPIIKKETTFIPGKGIVETGVITPTEVAQTTKISSARQFLSTVESKKEIPKIKTAIDAYIEAKYATPSPEQKAHESNIMSGRQYLKAIIEGQKEGLTQKDLTIAAFEGKTPMEKVIDTKTQKLVPLSTSLETIQQKIKNIEAEAQQKAVEVTKEGTLVLNEKDYADYNIAINEARQQEEAVLQKYNAQVKDINRVIRETQVLTDKQSRLPGFQEKKLGEVITGFSESELAAVSKFSSPEYGTPSTVFDIRQAQPGFVGMSYVGESPKTYQELVDITASGETQRKYLLGQEYERVVKGQAPTEVVASGLVGAGIGGLIGGVLTIGAGGVGAIPGAITGFETGVAAGGAAVLSREYVYRQTGDIEKAEQVGTLIGLGVGAAGAPFEMATAKVLTKELGLAPKLISQTTKIVGREVIEPITDTTFYETGSGIATRKISQPTLKSSLGLGVEKTVIKETPVKYSAVGEIIESIPKKVEIQTITPTQYYEAFGEIVEETPKTIGAVKEAYLLKQTGLKTGKLSPAIKAISFSEQEAAKLSDQEFTELALRRQKLFEAFSGEMLYKKTGEVVFEGAGKRGKDIKKVIDYKDVLQSKTEPYVYLFPRFTEKQIAEQVIEEAPFSALMKLEKETPGTLADIKELQPELAAKARAGLTKKDFEAAQFLEARIGGKYSTVEEPMAESFRTRLKFVESAPQGEYDKLIIGKTKEGVEMKTIIQRGVLAPKREAKEPLGELIVDAKKSSKSFLRNMFKEIPLEKESFKPVALETKKPSTGVKKSDVVIPGKGQTVTIQKTSELEKQFAEAEQLARASQMAGKGVVPELLPEISASMVFSGPITFTGQQQTKTMQNYFTGTDTITPTRLKISPTEIQSTPTSLKNVQQLISPTKQARGTSELTMQFSATASPQAQAQAEQQLTELMQTQQTLQETQLVSAIGITPATTIINKMGFPPIIPPILGSGGETKQGAGYTQLKQPTKTKKTKPLFQIKSDYFRKFTTGEKDLPATPQNIQLIKKIRAQKGSFFGIIPTKQQLERKTKKKWLI